MILLWLTRTAICLHSQRINFNQENSFVQWLKQKSKILSRHPLVYMGIFAALCCGSFNLILNAKLFQSFFILVYEQMNNLRAGVCNLYRKCMISIIYILLHNCILGMMFPKLQYLSFSPYWVSEDFPSESSSKVINIYNVWVSKTSQFA